MKLLDQNPILVRKEIITLGKLTLQDSQVIRQCKTPENQLGFAYQLAFVRTRNYLPKQVPLELDTVLLHYVSNQLSLPSDLMQSYQLNRRVIQRHQHKIKTYLAVKEYTASNQEELADYLIKQARQTDQITLLVPKVQCFLKEKGILQPALSTLRRLVGKYRDLARREIESNFLNVLKNTVREKLDVLLKVNNRRSILLKTTQNLNQQNNAEILCKNDYALSF